MILKLRYLNCGLDVPNEVFRCVHTTVFLKPLLRPSTGLFSNFLIVLIFFLQGWSLRPNRMFEVWSDTYTLWVTQMAILTTPIAFHTPSTSLRSTPGDGIVLIDVGSHI